MADAIKRHYLKVLRLLLGRYVPAKNHLEKLNNRLEQAKQELKHPTVGAINYTGMPKGSGISDPTAAPSINYDVAIHRVNKQIDYVNSLAEDIQYILSFLEDGTDNKNIIEMRYIDGKSDKEILKELHYADRSTISYHINKGLYMLLEETKVIDILKKYDKGE